jgi:hypothetical protein
MLAAEFTVHSKNLDVLCFRRAPKPFLFQYFFFAIWLFTFCEMVHNLGKSSSGGDQLAMGARLDLLDEVSQYCS